MKALRLALPLYPGVAMIALGDFRGGEPDSTMEVAIYGNDLDPGEANSALTDEAALGNWQVRIFGKGSSGCQVLIEDDRVKYTESGLTGFINMPCTVIRDRPYDGDTLLIVWRHERRYIDASNIHYIARRMGGLRAAFA